MLTTTKTNLENSNYFLYLNSEYPLFTMSPSGYNGEMGAYLFVIINGKISSKLLYQDRNYPGIVVPVISIKGDLEVANGDGTYDNPYIIYDNREEITFTVDGTIYTALEGMTFRQWVKITGYTTASYTCYNDETIGTAMTDAGANIIYEDSGNSLNCDDVLTDGLVLTVNSSGFPQ